MKVKTGDKVLVTAGKDKGKKSVVMRTVKKHNKVLVEAVNIVSKHIKKTATSPGQKIKLERGIDSSNVKVICPHCDKAVRVKYSFTEERKKFRVCKKCNESLEKKVASSKKK